MSEIEARLDVLETTLRRLQAHAAEARPADVTPAKIERLDRQRVELREDLAALHELGGTAPREMSAIIARGIDDLERAVAATAVRCGLEHDGGAGEERDRP